MLCYLHRTRGTDAGDCSLPISLTYPRPLQQLLIKKQEARLLFSISIPWPIHQHWEQKHRVLSGVREILLRSGHQTQASPKQALRRGWASVQAKSGMNTHLLHWDYSQTNIPPGSIKSYASSPTHFKINWRPFDQKWFSTNDQVFKIFQLSSHKEHIISIFYLTSAYSNLTSGDSTPTDPELHQTRVISQVNPLTAVPHIYMALKHPPTHQKNQYWT